VLIGQVVADCKCIYSHTSVLANVLQQSLLFVRVEEHANMMLAQNDPNVFCDTNYTINILINVANFLIDRIDILHICSLCIFDLLSRKCLYPTELMDVIVHASLPLSINFLCIPRDICC